MRLLRLLCLAPAATAALALVAMPAVAGSCCGEGLPPVPFAYPTGYQFDPRDHSAPLYIVEQGPILSGPGIYTRHDTYVPPSARPTYWGDYAVVTPDAYPTPFPYVHRSYWRRGYYPYGVAPYRVYPY